MKVIYTVTVFQNIKHNMLDKHRYIPTFGDRRCLGWFNNIDEAKTSIKDHAKDMNNDGTYNYAIIEEMPTGILVQDTNRLLYKWNGSDFEEIHIPTELEHSCNFGIG